MGRATAALREAVLVASVYSVTFFQARLTFFQVCWLKIEESEQVTCACEEVCEKAASSISGD